jgi:phosphatidylserine/phosphatidylglycerophosphate/cardiolipin synthase-like enzyme
MPIYFCKEFLNDLRVAQDARFVREVFNHTVAEDGTFTSDRNDHRYDGIKDAWIRYVTRGNSGYRVIFLRKGPDVFLYRCGRHSVEDRLASPKTLEGALQMGGSPNLPATASNNPAEGGALLKTSEPAFLSRHIESMYHVKHNEIYLVAPFIQMDLLESRHPFGRFLDRAIEEDTLVSVITTADQDDSCLPAFKKLEERGVSVFFVPSLHTKLYVFDVDLASRNQWQQGVHSHAIVGSSNLTKAGLGFAEGRCNEELNCRLPTLLTEDIKKYVTKLIVSADDFRRHEFRKRTGRPK